MEKNESFNTNISKYCEEIIAWTKDYLKPYSNRIQIENLDSFKSGIAFILLIYAYDSKIIDIDSFQLDDPFRTLEAAFSIAEQHLKIPNILNTETAFELKNQANLILYLYQFKIKVESLNQSLNFIETSQKTISDLQNFLLEQDQPIAITNYNLEKANKRLQTIKSRDNLYREKNDIENYLVTLEDNIKQTDLLINEFQTQNSLLKDQNELLNLKFNLASKLLFFEKQKRQKTENDSLLEQKIISITELLQDQNLELFLEAHKKNFD